MAAGVPAVASTAAAAGERPRGRELLGQVAWYVPSAIIPAAVALLAATVFTRMFSTADYGAFSLALSLAAFAAAVASQWLQQGITRYLPGERDTDAAAGRRGAAALGLAIIGGSVLAAAVMVSGAGAALGASWTRWVMPTALVTLGGAAFAALGAVLQSTMKARHYSVYRVTEAVLRFLLALGLAVSVARDPVSLVWGAALSALMVLPLMWRSAALPSLRGLREGHHADTLRAMAAYGIPMVGWYLAALFLDVGDRFMIQWLRGPAEVGLYAANYGLVYGAVGLLAAPMLLAAHPFLMRAWSAGQPEVAASWLARIAEWYLLAGLLASGVVWLFGRELAALLLGAEFRPGWVVLVPVVGGLVLWQLGMYMHKPLEFTGRTRQLFVIALSVAALNLVLNLWLIPLYGYSAAAWTTLACFAVYAAVMFAAGQRYLAWRPDLGRLAAIAVPMLATLWLARLAAPVWRAVLVSAMIVVLSMVEWRALRARTVTRSRT